MPTNRQGRFASVFRLDQDGPNAYLGGRRQTGLLVRRQILENAHSWARLPAMDSRRPERRDCNSMPKEDHIEMDGTVVEVLAGGLFRVETDDGLEVLAHLAGKMRRYRIRVVLGDRVTVAVSPYDPTRGRIVYRPK